MMANAWHHRADAVSSVVALIGVGGSILGVEFLDPLAGLYVSVLILKAYIESGYQRYKAENAGKYPPPKATQQQVGKSYYIVRNILQELEYNSKQSSTSSSVTSEPQLEDNKPKEEFTPLQEVKEGPSSKTKTDLTYATKRSDQKDDSKIIVVNSVVLDEATSYTFKAEVENLGSIDMPHSEDTLNTNTTSDSSYSDVFLDSNEPELVQEAGCKSDKLENEEVSCLSSEEPDNSEKKTASQMFL